MPTPAYLTISGATQGEISKGANSADSMGNNWQEGHEDECLIQALLTNVAVPTDPQSGTPTGQRVHLPTSFTKQFDKASPLLWNALASGELLQMTLKFYRTNTAGQQEHYFTIAWEDVILVSGRASIPNCLDPDNKNYSHMEDWQFSYRKVSWTQEKAGTSGSDDWRKPISA